MNTYSLKLTILLIISFNGLFLGVLIFLGHLIKDFKSSRTWFLFILFFIFGLFQVHYIFFEVGKLHQYKIINLFPVLAISFLGPSIYVISQHTLSFTFRLIKDYYKHFIIGILISIITAILIFFSDPEQTKLIPGYFYNESTMYVGCFAYLMFILYLALSIRAFIKSFVFSRSILRENPFVLAILSILLFMIAGCVLDIMALIFNSRLFMEFALIILNLVIVTLFFILFRFPEYGKKIKKIVQHETKRRSYLKGVDVQVLETKINQLIQEEEIFTDENLTLDSMAEKLNISRHQLSELLNKKLGENFSSFIKKYRIKKAKQLLIEYPDMNILNIAFDVGFKSKSTFNDAFSKLERTTPAQFRKQNL